ncbi:MAG TPA: hypothetical protein VMX17_17060 [Candidatus Glassbacteria bacterium]|nr:hypothetical protein [Candidatus Glassbacteria bacterium]
MKKNKSPFETVIELFTSEDVEVSNPFLVNRILSYQPDTVLLAIEINKYMSRLPGWAIKAVFNIGIRKRRKRPYLNYPKSSKLNKNQILIRSKISKAFCANNTYADQIIKLIKKQGEEPEKYFGLKTS